MDQTADQVLDQSRTRTRASRFAALRVLLGAIWLLNAGIQAYSWLWPAPAQGSSALLHAYSKSIASAPAWLQPYLDAVVHGVQHVGPRWVALAMVLIATGIGISLISNRWVTRVSWVGIVYCLFCWSTLDSFGYPYAHGQTDPGVFINYILAFVMVLSARSASLPGEPRVGRDPFRTARILFGLLWTVDAVLKWQPYFLTHFTAQLTGVLAGQPAWIAAYIDLVIRVVQFIGPFPVAVLVALVESLIALSLLSGRGLRLSLPLGALYCLSVWTTAEGWGGPYTSAGTGVRGNVLGNVIIYVVLFLYLWAAQTRAPASGDDAPGAKAGLRRLA